MTELAPLTLDRDIPPYVRVAFELGYGSNASEGTVFDIDEPLLQQALEHGGLHAAQYQQHPVIIRSTDQPTLRGRAVYESTQNHGQPAIELYSYRATGAIPAAAAAHEARHLADYLEGTPTTSNRDRRLRKVAATCLAVATIAAMTKTRLDTAGSLEPWSVAGTVVVTDMLINASLIMEYLTRKHERRARGAATGIEHANLLITEGLAAPDIPPQAPRAAHILRQFVVPDFSL